MNAVAVSREMKQYLAELDEKRSVALKICKNNVFLQQSYQEIMQVCKRVFSVHKNSNRKIKRECDNCIYWFIYVHCVSSQQEIANYFETTRSIVRHGIMKIKNVRSMPKSDPKLYEKTTLIESYLKNHPHGKTT